MRWALVVACCAFGAFAPETALASGGPAPPMQGGAGVSARGSLVRYVAVGRGQNTVVESVSRANGRLERSSRIAGSFGVAVATNDGATTGLSADGRTLVLADMLSNNATYPPARTQLVVLDTRALLPRAQITLTGYYSVDAISPTGRWLYLIHLLSLANNHYEVRAYDLSRQRLLPRPVVDPHETGPMSGLPVTRVMSNDGRWAYTLYDRSPSAPFIHALDTQRRAAVCVDLPYALEGTLFSSRLVLGAGGRTVQIELGGTPLASVDTRTFAVGTPPAMRPTPARRAASPARRPTSPGGGGEFPWSLGAVALIVALVALAAYRRSKVRAAAPAAG